MNKSKIDWTDSTWNPVTGCLHSCPFCYAEKMATRFGFDEFPWRTLESNEDVKLVHGQSPMLELQTPFTDRHGRKQPYPISFLPTLHRYKLNEYKNKKSRTIFVGSMTDLFGAFIPDEWIMAVFDACSAAPQHRYLFLTKNPERYATMANKEQLPKNNNYWYGQTVTRNTGKVFIEPPGVHGRAYKTFISIEPILEPIRMVACYTDWVIVGAESGNRKGKAVPEREWIESVVCQCQKYNVPVFMKESLRGLMGDGFIQEYPWEATKK